MSDKVVQLKIDTAINNAETVTSIGDIRRALKELQGLAIEYQETNTEAFNKVTTAAGLLKDKVNDAKAAISSVSGDPIENLGKSFKLAGSSLLSLDFTQASTGLKLFTSNIQNLNPADVSTKLKDLTTQFKAAGDAITEKFPKAGKTIEGLTNVIGGLGRTVTSALGGDFKSAIGGLGQSFKGLGEIIKANPLLLLATIVITLVANFKELAGAGGLVGKVFTAIGSIISTITGLFTSLTDAIGLTDSKEAEHTKNALENSKKRQEAYEAEVAMLKERNKVWDDAKSTNIKLETALMPDGLAKTLKQISDAKDEAQKAIDEKIKALPKVTQRGFGGDPIVAELKKQNDLLDQKAEKDKIDARIKFNKEAADKQHAADETARTKREQAKNKELAREQKLAQDELKNIEDQGNNILELDDKISVKRLDKLTDKLNEQGKFIIENADKLYPGLTGKPLEDRIQNELDKLEGKYNKELSTLDKFNKEKNDKRKEQIAKEDAIDMENAVGRLRNASDGAAAIAESDPTLANTLAAIDAENAYQQAARVVAMQSELADVENNEALKQSIRDKYRKMDEASDKKTEQTKLKARLDTANKSIGIAQNFSNVLSSLNDLITQGEKLTIEMQKRQFARQKALGIVSAVINTAQGITAALTQPPPYSFIAAALTGVAGALQIATIASKRFDPDSADAGGSAAPAVGSLPGIADSANISAPSLVGLDGKPDIGQNRVYVVESDITDAQGRVARARDNSRLGN